MFLIHYLYNKSNVPQNALQKEWVSPLQRLEKEKCRHYPEAELIRTDTIVTNPYLSAPYSDTLFREKIRNIDDARQVFPAACFQANGRIVPPQLREAHAQLGIFMTDSEFTSLWQRYDKEGLGAIRTSLFLKRAAIDTRPKTFSHRSKTSVELKVRPKSEAKVVTLTHNSQTEESEPSAQDIPGETTQETAEPTKETDNTDKNKASELATSKDSGEPDKGEEIKINISRKKKVVHQRTSTTSTEVRCRTSVGFRADRGRPQSAHIRSKTSLSITRSVTDHYEFEESYNAMLSAFDLFDYLSDGYISRVDFRRVLQEFGLNISVTDLDNFLARNGVRTIRGQVNYKEFLNKFQSKSENSVTNRVVTSQQFQDKKFPAWPLPQHSLTSEELDVRLVDLLHGDFLKLIGYFKSCDKYGLGVITPHEFRSGIEKRLGYPMSEHQWEQVKCDVGQDSDGLIPYNKFLQMFDVPPGSWNRKQEGGLDVCQVIPASMVMKILEELFRNRFHTFDKHFQDMDRRKTGRMSKWQFGALLRLCGVSLTNSELDRVWVRLNVSNDGMYSYKSLIKAFAHKQTGQDVRREQTDSDTRELIETAKRVQRERREKSVSSQQQKTTTTVTTNTGEVATTTQTTTVASVTENNTKTTTVDTVVAQKAPGTALSNKSQRTRDLLNKINNNRGSCGIRPWYVRITNLYPLYPLSYGVVGNWEGLKTVFKFIDKNGNATISISDMKEVLNTMKFPMSEEDKRDLCQRFDLQRNGRFHYLEFMKCYSQNPPHLSKSQVFSKHTHKLERKLMSEHKNLRRAFRKLDINRRGELGISDFRRALVGCNIRVSNEDFYHILSEFDQEMKGSVSYNDFLSTFVDNL
uniref:EF-hand calcium-binding domain-containing protein 6 n=1 Tax=Magallana gigas TaxID=29159 RepID=K1QIE8_MAGGI